MALFSPRTYPEIMGEMVGKLISSTPLTDVNFGSVFTVMLEAAATEDDQQYFSMLEIIRAYSIDSATGTDLDDRAFEYGLVRLAAQTASSTVTIADSAITKISTGVYSGLSGASSGSFAINGDSPTGFPTTGSIIVGRGTPNVEAVAYTSITTFPNYCTFNLSTAFSKDHGTDETIVLSHGGARSVAAGTVVLVPASDINPRVEFTLDSLTTILDGESETTGAAVTASGGGAASNVPIGSIISFDTLPFATATVTNTFRITNGRDIESDQDLRDRIKSHIQSLSRGTSKSIISGVVGVLSSTENKRVVSASLVEPTIPADVVKLFIDDGTGFIASFAHTGFEEVVPYATGGEKFLSINNVPIVKAFVESQNEEPFPLVGGETFFVQVGGSVETITFASTDFASPGAATAQEVLKKINNNAALFESRVSSGGTKLRIFSRSNSDEEIAVTGGSANVSLNFQTDQKVTTKLYLERNGSVSLLNKDGKTASIESGSAAGYNMSAYENILCMVIDGRSENPQYAHFLPTDFASPASVTSKEIANILNLQISGITASSSSNDTKITVTSNIKRDSSSKVRIVDKFNKVFANSGIVWTDMTTAVNTDSMNLSFFSTDGDYLYLGHEDVRFGSIFFNFSSFASSAVTYTSEFWNGTAWESFGMYDGTAAFTQNGIMSFRIPHSWSKTIVHGSNSSYWVRFKRNMPVLATPPVESRIKISSANEIFNFSETEVSGFNKDYTLNRFVGQIELESPLQSGDTLALGSHNTRASITSVAGPYALFGGENLACEIDGVSISVTFQSGDFFTSGSALPAEVLKRLNTSLLGTTSTLVTAGTRINTISNKMNGGSIRVTGGTANLVLGFPTTLASALVSHVAAAEGINTSPYMFSASDSIVVVMNGNNANNFTVPVYRAGTSTSGTTATSIFDTTLNVTFPLAADLIGYDVLFTSGSQMGSRRTISNYIPASGLLTVATFTGSPSAGDAFQILPKTASQLVKFWNNKGITLLSTGAEITVSSGGSKVQIASLSIGEASSVAVVGGTGNLVLGFPTDTLYGVDAYRSYTGLAQITQWKVDGRISDPDTYPGIRAAGVQVEVIEPVKIPISVELRVTAQDGVTLSSIANDVRSAVSAYINTLPVGADVIVSRITCDVLDVSGVADVKVVKPLANIAVADNELARITDNSITVG